MGNELLTFSMGFVMLGGGVDVDVRRSVDVGGAIVVSGGVEDTGGEATCDYARSTSPLLSITNPAAAHHRLLTGSNPTAAGEGTACRFL